MLNLVSLIKNKALILTGLVLAVFFLHSCRKKIEHGSASNAHWNPVESTIGKNIRALEVFDNELYAAGSDDPYQALFAKISPSFELIDFESTRFISTTPSSPNTYAPIIFDLAVVNNQLYLAGNFILTDPVTPSYCLATCDPTNGLQPLVVFDHQTQTAYSVSDFNGDVVVTGEFEAYSGSLFSTDNILKLVADVPNGLANTQPWMKSVAHNGELHIAGYYGYSKWDGSNWGGPPYNGVSQWDDVSALCSYNGELYLSGDFYGTEILKKLNTSGDWEDVPGLTGYAGNSGMKVIDGKLYLYNGNMEIDEVPASSIICFDGTSWENVGDPGFTQINDLVKYNGHLFACANGIVFKYPIE